MRETEGVNPVRAAGRGRLGRPVFRDCGPQGGPTRRGGEGWRPIASLEGRLGGGYRWGCSVFGARFWEGAALHRPGYDDLRPAGSGRGPTPRKTGRPNLPLPAARTWQALYVGQSLVALQE